MNGGGGGEGALLLLCFFNGQFQKDRCRENGNHIIKTQEHLSRIPPSKVERGHTTMMNADMDDLSARVDAVKEENLKLKSENQVLGQYIENLMSASSVFQTTDTKSKRK
ncbi:short coiled-coil protein isoform X4 [Pezoporus flaviventris]|uniref:short coiled-coil protein isoform X4 n=1 Tax=Pezoporus flaviventris TaxID=889875 RepID=UPI002AAF0D4E|nr:short coiled-coil protein isoform X4 [Pezoporus flaviventris]